MASAQGCPNEQEFRDRVAVRLGTDPFVTAQSADLLRVSVERSPSLVATVTVIGRDVRVRALTGSGTCVSLVDEVVLAVSVLVDASGWTADDAPDEVGDETREASVAPVDVPSTPALVPPISDDVDDTDDADDAADVVAELAFGAGASVGLLPTVGFVTTLRASLRWRHLRLALGLRADLLGGGDFAIGSASVQLVTGEARACGVVDWFYACGSVLAGALFGRGEELVAAQRFANPYLSGGIVTGAEFWPWARLGFFVEVDLRTSVLRTELLVGAEGVWTSPVVAGGAHAGLSVQF